jgi:hypothetical protein
MKDVYVDVVPPDVPLLLGLDLMDRLRLQFLSVSNNLEHVSPEGKSWRLLVVRKYGHGYIEWSVENVLCALFQVAASPSPQAPLSSIDRQATQPLETSHPRFSDQSDQGASR